VLNVPGNRNRIGGVMDSVLARVEGSSGQTKDYKIGICCFSAKHASLRTKSKYWLARNQDDVSKWVNMSISGLLFQWASITKSNSASPAYGVYISQLIRYARASSNHSDFLKRHLHLRNRLLDQGYKRAFKTKNVYRFSTSLYMHQVSVKALVSRSMT
jgi:hypothetical protein